VLSRGPTRLTYPILIMSAPASSAEAVHLATCRCQAYPTYTPQHVHATENELCESHLHKGIACRILLNLQDEKLLTELMLVLLCRWQQLGELV
jgi:hypothetical protein